MLIPSVRDTWAADGASIIGDDLSKIKVGTAYTDTSGNFSSFYDNLDDDPGVTRWEASGTKKLLIFRLAGTFNPSAEILELGHSPLADVVTESGTRPTNAKSLAAYTGTTNYFVQADATGNEFINIPIMFTVPNGRVPYFRSNGGAVMVMLYAIEID